MQTSINFWLAVIHSVPCGRSILFGGLYTVWIGCQIRGTLESLCRIKENWVSIINIYLYYLTYSFLAFLGVLYYPSMMEHWGSSAWQRLQMMFLLLENRLQGHNSLDWSAILVHHFLYGVFKCQEQQVALLFSNMLLVLDAVIF